MKTENKIVKGASFNGLKASGAKPSSWISISLIKLDELNPYSDSAFYLYMKIGGKHIAIQTCPTNGSVEQDRTALMSLFANASKALENVSFA